MKKIYVMPLAKIHNLRMNVVMQQTSDLNDTTSDGDMKYGGERDMESESKSWGWFDEDE